MLLADGPPLGSLSAVSVRLAREDAMPWQSGLRQAGTPAASSSCPQLSASVSRWSRVRGGQRVLEAVTRSGPAHGPGGRTPSRYPPGAASGP